MEPITVGFKCILVIDLDHLDTAQMTSVGSSKVLEGELVTGLIDFCLLEVELL